MLSGPSVGTSAWPCSRKYSIVARPGAGPLAFSASTLPVYFM
jgi:hypothetical protein